jgi:hypothetical protein
MGLVSATSSPGMVISIKPLNLPMRTTSHSELLSTFSWSWRVEFFPIPPMWKSDHKINTPVSETDFPFIGLADFSCLENHLRWLFTAGH